MQHEVNSKYALNFHLKQQDKTQNKRKSRDIFDVDRMSGDGVI